MKAITIRQPYAWCITEDDRITAAGQIAPKLVENRGRNVRHRGLVAIHAAQLWSVDGEYDARVQAAWGAVVGLVPPLVPEAVPRGAVVAVANLVDCHKSGDGAHCCTPWGDRLYAGWPARHLVLADIRRLPEPVPVKGRQAVPWTLPDDVAAQVAAQLEEVAQ